MTELRKLRRKHGGIDAEKLLAGAEKKKKKKKRSDDPNQWNLKTGGLIDPEAYRQKMDEEESASKSKKLKLDSFATATNRLDVDKHMYVTAFTLYASFYTDSSTLFSVGWSILRQK